VSSAGGPKASMSGSSVALQVAAWNSAKAAAANGSGALRKRREAARAVASAGAPGSESMMSGAFASSREGPASPEPEASAGGRSVECGSMLLCDESLLAGVDGVDRGEDGAGQRRGSACDGCESEAACDDFARHEEQPPQRATALSTLTRGHCHARMGNTSHNVSRILTLYERLKGSRTHSTGSGSGIHPIGTSF